MAEFLPSIIRSLGTSTLISSNGDRIFTGHQNGHLVEWSIPSHIQENVIASRYIPNAHGPAASDDKTHHEQMSSDRTDMRLKVDRGARDKNDTICTISAMTLVSNEKGDRIITGGADGVVCCWDAPTLGQAGWSSAAAISPLGKSRTKSPPRASTTSPRTRSPMRGVSIKEGRGKTPPRPSGGATVSSPEANALPNMPLLAELGKHKGPVTALVTVQTKKELLVVSAGIDTLVKVWSVDGQTLKQTLRGHTDRVWCLGCAPACPFLLSGGLDSTIRVYEINSKSFNHLKTLKGHKAPVKTIKVCALPLQDKHVAVSGSEDCSVRIYSLGDQISLLTSFELTLPVSTLTAIPALGGGMFMVVGNDDGFSHGGLEVWGVGQLTSNDESTDESACVDACHAFEGGARYMGTLTNAGLVPLTVEARLAKAASLPRSERRAGGEAAVVALAAQAYSSRSDQLVSLATDVDAAPEHGVTILDKTTVTACDREGRIRVWRSLDWAVLSKPVEVVSTIVEGDDANGRVAEDRNDAANGTQDESMVGDSIGTEGRSTKDSGGPTKDLAADLAEEEDLDPMAAYLVSPPSASFERVSRSSYEISTYEVGVSSGDGVSTQDEPSVPMETTVSSPSVASTTTATYLSSATSSAVIASTPNTSTHDIGASAESQTEPLAEAPIPDWVMAPFGFGSPSGSNADSAEFPVDSVHIQEPDHDGDAEDAPVALCSDEDLAAEGWTRVDTGEAEFWVVVGEPELSQLERPGKGTLAELRRFRDETLAARAAAKALKKQKKAEEAARLKAEEELIHAEKEARLKAEEEARLAAERAAQLKAEQDARVAAEEEARLKAEEEARLASERAAKLKAEEEARRIAEKEARLKAEEEAQLAAAEEARHKAEQVRESRRIEEERLTAEEAEAAAILASKAEAQDARLRAASEAEDVRLAELAAAAQQRLKDKIAAHEARLKAEADAVEAQLEQQAREAEERLQARIKAKEAARLKAEEEARRAAEEEESLLKAEQEARQAAQKAAKLKAEEDARLVAEEEARLKAEEEARLAAERAAQLKAEQDARVAAEEEARLKAEEEARLAAERAAKLKAEEDARITAQKAARLKAEEEARIVAEEEKARLKAEKAARAKQIENEEALEKEHAAGTASGKYCDCDWFQLDVTATAGTCKCGNMKAKHSPYALKPRNGGGVCKTGGKQGRRGTMGGGVGARVQALTEYIAELDRKDLEAGGTGKSQGHLYKPLGHRMEPQVPLNKLDPWANRDPCGGD